MWETKFHIQRQNYSFVYSNFYAFFTADKKTKGSALNDSKHYQIQSPLNLHLNQILIFYSFPNIWTVPHFQRTCYVCMS
jgi:hypothetical protein